MNLIIIFIDIVGIICFLVAAIFAYKSNAMIKDASKIWLYFGTSSLMAIIWISSFIAGQVINLPDIIEPTLFFAVIFLFTLVAMSSLFDFIKLQGKLER